MKTNNRLKKINHGTGNARGNFPSGRLLLSVAFTALLFALATPAHAADAGVDEIVGTVDRTIRTYVDTQNLVDDWAGEKETLEKRYNELLGRKLELEARNKETAAKIDAVSRENDEIRRMISESTKILSGLETHLFDVGTKLENSVETNLPFLEEERRTRLSRLSQSLSSPDIALSEKYRQTLEILGIEAEYGRSCEVYNESIEIDGQRRFCRVLRLGRLGLFACTPDGKYAAVYDPSAKAWNPSPASEIDKAIAIVESGRDVDFVNLPLGRLSRQ